MVMMFAGSSGKIDRSLLGLFLDLSSGAMCAVGWMDGWMDGWVDGLMMIYRICMWEMLIQLEFERSGRNCGGVWKSGLLKCKEEIEKVEERERERERDRERDSIEMKMRSIVSLGHRARAVL